MTSEDFVTDLRKKLIDIDKEFKEGLILINLKGWRVNLWIAIICNIAMIALNIFAYFIGIVSVIAISVFLGHLIWTAIIVFKIREFKKQLKKHYEHTHD